MTCLKIGRFCPTVLLSLVCFWANAAMAGGEAYSAEPLFTSAPLSPNEFTGTDVERINQALAAAAGTGRPVVIPKWNLRDGERRADWVLDAAILVGSDTTLILDDCRLKLSDRSRDNFIRSANCGLGITEIETISNVHILGRGRPVLEGADRPRATGDSAKTLGARSYGTDAGVDGESQTGDWRNIGVLLAHVEQFTIENLHFRDSHAWAVSLERCVFGRIRNLDFASTGKKLIDGVHETLLNQDGLNLRQGCHDITIENITGYTGDDLLALTAIVSSNPQAGSTESTMVSAANNRGEGRDDIRHVIVRNVRGHCAGGHHIVRFLNGGGLKIHDVLLDGLIDTSGAGTRCRAALKIGDSNPAWGGVTPLGDTSRLLISNIVSRATDTILIGGSLADSAISNVLKYETPGDPIAYQSGPEYVRNVLVSNSGNAEDSEQ